MCASFFRIGVVSWLLVAGLFGCNPRGRAGTASAPEVRALRVAAAADVEPAFVELGRRFTEKSASRRQVVFSLASSSVLAKQVEQGAPFDLFAAANAELIEHLAQSGYIVRASVRPYARGRLILWTSAKETVDTAPPASAGGAIAGLRSPRYRRIAIANPEHAPYGQAAVQALRAAGLFDELRPRLIYGENIRQAHQYVATGNADVVIGALSLAKDAGGSYTLVPEALYAPLVQVLGIVKGGDEAGAAQFLDLIFSAEGQAILQRHGFLPAPTK